MRLSPLTTVASYDDLINASERNGQVQIRGTCDSGHEVNYWLFNTVTGVVSDTVTVTSTGTTWSAYISLEQWFQVGDGTLQLNVTQTDWAGNVSDTVDTLLTLDSLALAPVVNPVAGDDRINQQELGQVSLSGAAEPGATVTLSLQGALGSLSKTLVANASTGTWAVGLTAGEWAQLGEGSIRLTASQTDRAGNVSPPAVRNLTLPSGTDSINVPKVATGTLTGVQTADAAHPAGVLVENEPEPLRRAAAQVVLVEEDGVVTETRTLSYCLLRILSMNERPNLSTAPPTISAGARYLKNSSQSP